MKKSYLFTMIAAIAMAFTIVPASYASDMGGKAHTTKAKKTGGKSHSNAKHSSKASK
jgi:hypothetical protein